MSEKHTKGDIEAVAASLYGVYWERPGDALRSTSKTTYNERKAWGRVARFTLEAQAAMADAVASDEAARPSEAAELERIADSLEYLTGVTENLAGCFNRLGKSLAASTAAKRKKGES